MSANAPAPPPPEVWQAAYLRLIAFPTEPAYDIRQNWWQELTGLQSTELNDKRQQREREESGEYDGITLTLNTDILRVQWTAQLVVTPSEMMERFPAIGPFPERNNWFVPLMGRWLANCPPLKRLTFAARLEQPVTGHQEGYERLNQYLRRVDLDPESSDLLYRINLRRPSVTGIPNLLVNRISTWVVRKSSMAMIAHIGGGDPEAGQQIRAERYAATVELDINTHHNYPGELPHNELARVFEDLAEGATEIATHGVQ